MTQNNEKILGRTDGCVLRPKLAERLTVFVWSRELEVEQIRTMEMERWKNEILDFGRFLEENELKMIVISLVIS